MGVVVVYDDVRYFTRMSMAMDDLDAVKYARTPKQMDKLFRRLVAQGETIDELWLDHDLGYGDQDPCSFSRVPLDTRGFVAKLEEDAVNGVVHPIKKVYVHTASSVGGPWIVSALSKYYDVERVSARAKGLVGGF